MRRGKRSLASKSSLKIILDGLAQKTPLLWSSRPAFDPAAIFPYVTSPWSLAGP